MNFKQGIKKSNSKTRDGLRIAIIIYENNKFYALLKDNTKLNVNPYDFNNDKVKYIYSTPNNNKHLVWTRINKSININIEHLDIICKYWATIKPNMKVKGIINNNNFIIKKY